MIMKDRSTCGWGWVSGVGVLVGALSGCGDQNLFESLADDNTTVAAVESAKIAIDTGNFTEAIVTLQGLCGTSTATPTCDAETVSLLASAYAGRAGLNVFDLIENAVDTTIGATDSFSSFSTLLASPTAGDKSDLHSAVDLLANLSNPTANQDLQMAIAAMADIVVTTGVDLTAGFNANTGSPNVVPTLTDVQNAETATETVTQVANDLDLVIQGLAGSGLANEELADDISQIEDAMDANQDGTVSDAELQSFLASL